MLTCPRWAAVLTATTALALAGCTTTIPGTPSVAPAARTAQAPTPPLVTVPLQAPTTPDGDTRLMIREFRAETGVTTGQASDALLVLYADGACGNIDRTPTRNGVLAAVLTLSKATGWPLSSAGFFVGAAVAARCPRHIGLVQAQ